MEITNKFKLEVWNKGDAVSGHNPQVRRKDKCGAWILFESYGDRNNQYGWEIDHIKPQSKEGSDNLTNLTPLQWENNLSKSDGKLVCKIKAFGTLNSKIIGLKQKHND